MVSPIQSRQDPEVIRSLREYRLALIQREVNQTERLASAWIEIETKLNDDMLLLALEIQQKKMAGDVITEQLLRRMDRYQKLQAGMKNEILDYAKDTAIPDIEAEQLEYGKMAIQSASKAIKLSGELGVQFDRLPVDAVETFVGHLGDGTPLYRLIKEAYPESLDAVVKSLLEGTAKGINPQAIAFNMSRSLGVGLERITLIARTEQLRVARMTSAEQYRKSGLNGVMRRVATKDDRVCPACLALDGEVIPLDKELEDHPRGRCVAVFQIKNTPTIQWEKGQDWFAKQEDSLQKNILGNEKWQLWKDGQFQFSDLGQKTYSKIWGASPRVPSIQELTQ